MRRMRSLILTTVFVAAGAVGLTAQSTTIPGPMPPNPNPTDVVLTGVNGTWDYISGLGNVYVGPYYLAFGTSLTNHGTPFDVYCVDYANDVSVGNTWDAYFTGLASADLSHTRLVTDQLLSAAAATERYQEAAWLAMQFSANPTSTWGSIHTAIWEIMGPSTTIGSTGPGPGTWITQAQAAYAGGYAPDLSSIVVISDVAGSKQEYVAFTPTPEPETLLLLGVGMLGLLLVAGYRRFA